MAVEAQLCPQCGAAVQFGAGQTEVVCGHCGTTVVKAAAPGGSATSVEKELEAEKLIQQTVGLEKKLHAHGRPATAKIVSAQATDVFRQAMEGRGVLMSFAVEVQPDGDGDAAFSADCKALVGLTAVDKYQPGALLDVRYDPQDHTRVSVEGRHGVKSPEERHREQQAKEQAPWKTKQVQPADPTAAAAGTPAWGGSSPQGSMPVPAEFAQVTNLGPAKSVHEHEGVRLIPHFGPPRPNVLVRYQDGFAFQAGKDLHTWRWEEVAVIQSNLWQRDLHDKNFQHEYTLTKTGGEQVIFDNGLPQVGEALQPFKKQVFARLLPPLAQSYNSGQALTFGPVTIHKQNGLQLEGKPYAWTAIRNIKVESGHLKVELRDGKQHDLRASAIPNIELLCHLIGVQLDEWALAAW